MCLTTHIIIIIIIVLCSFMYCLCSDDVPAEFICHIDVYCHKLHDDLTMASTPKKIKKKFNELGTSVGRSVGRRLSGIVSVTL